MVLLLLMAPLQRAVIYCLDLHFFIMHEILVVLLLRLQASAHLVAATRCSTDVLRRLDLEMRLARGECAGGNVMVVEWREGALSVLTKALLIEGKLALRTKLAAAC